MENTKKEIIICLICLLFLITFLIVLLKPSRKESPQETTNKYIEIQDSQDLKQIKNDASFQEKNTNLKEYLQEQSRYLIMNLERYLTSETNVVDFNNVDNLTVINLTNLLLAGDGENICYSTTYFKNKIYEIFGRQNIDLTKEKNYHDNKICFEEIFLNLEPTSKIIDYTEDSNNIYVKLKNNDKEFIFYYAKNKEFPFLEKVELINSSY